MTASGTTYGAARRSPVREFSSAVTTIMVKELRSRMRGRRAFVVLTAYLSVLAMITYGVYAVVGPVARETAVGDLGFGLSQANASRLIGQSIFSVLSIFQIVLVSMIAPAFTAGQISLEREKQTLDLLVTTPMRPGAIIIGKLVTALAFVILMILAAIPITAIVLMYGGASIDDIVRQQVLLLAVAVGFGAIGLFASALVQRTQAATVITYCLVLALTLGSAMVYAFWDQVVARNDAGFARGRDEAPEQLRYLNPMVGMLDIISNVEVDGPTRFTRSLYELFGTDLSTSSFAADEPFGGGVAPDLPVNAGFGDDDSGYWWPRVSISFVVVAAVLTTISTRLVVPAGMRWALRRRRRGAEPSGRAALGTPADGSPMIEELGEAER